MFEISRVPAELRPNLFIIGAQKAGTTWLFETLRRHSAIFGSKPKELFFWNRSAAGIEQHARTYFERFAAGADAVYRMEASANYLWSRRSDNQFDDPTFQRSHGWSTPGAIRAGLGEAPRFIVLFRQPTARAISAFFHHFRRGRIRPDDRLLMAGRRYGIIDKGFYEHSTPPWRAAFPADRILFLRFDDIRADPQGVVARCLRFLDLPSERLRAPARARNAGAGLVLRDDFLTVAPDAEAAQVDGAPRVYAEEALFLERIYRESIDYAEDALGQDLGAWRTGALEAVARL